MVDCPDYNLLQERRLMYSMLQKKGGLAPLIKCGNSEFKKGQCDKESRTWKLPHIMQLMAREYRLSARCFDFALTMTR